LIMIIYLFHSIIPQGSWATWPSCYIPFNTKRNIS